MPNITRELIQDDDGFDVIKLTNPLAGGIRYLRIVTTVATNSVTVINTIKAAPNPFQNHTLVTWDNAENATYQAQLFNVTGQVVRQYPQLNSGTLLIERENLRPGIYFLSMVDRAGNYGTVKLFLLD